MRVPMHVEQDFGKRTLGLRLTQSLLQDAGVGAAFRASRRFREREPHSLSAADLDRQAWTGSLGSARVQIDSIVDGDYERDV